MLDRDKPLGLGLGWALAGPPIGGGIDVLTEVAGRCRERYSWLAKGSPPPPPPPPPAPAPAPAPAPPMLPGVTLAATEEVLPVRHCASDERAAENVDVDIIGDAVEGRAIFSCRCSPPVPFANGL